MTIFVVWFAGFVLHLAMFAKTLGARGIREDVDNRTIIYATTALLAVAAGWPLFMMIYATRYLRGQR